MVKFYENRILINRNEELKKYDLDGKWNDYIAVQKEILRVLREEGVFNENLVCNMETGMKIRISPSGIRETFGNGNKFQRLPKELKEYKVITLGSLKEIIAESHLIEDNVENIHLEQMDTFAYFGKIVFIDENVEIFVRISIKKKVSSNHFHIHHIDINTKSPELLGSSNETNMFETQDFIKNITDN